MENWTSIVLPDGGLYIGKVNQNGKPEDENGTGTWANGRSYVGCWIDGAMSGVGTLYENGEVLHYGYWWKGELLHEFPPMSTSSTTEEPSQCPNRPEDRPSSVKSSHMTALLIGNNTYNKESPLYNCVSDAHTIANELGAIGVDVMLLANATKKQIIDAIKTLGEKADSYDNVLFFFTGHGMTNHGRHYIISIDEDNSDCLPVCIEEIDEFLSKTKYKNIILVSDACSTIAQGNGNTNRVETGGRTLMCFSSTFGTASDGIPGEHSPFAFGLLQYISKPMSVVDMFQEVNRFTMTYAANHEYYQIPQLIILANFSISLRLY